MSWLKKFLGSKKGCRSCGGEPVKFRCARCDGKYCDGCIHKFGEKAARILAERVYGKGTVIGSAKIFDGQGRAFCPDCYGKLLDRSLRTGQWVVQSQEEMDPSVVRVDLRGDKEQNIERQAQSRPSEEDEQIGRPETKSGNVDMVGDPNLEQLIAYLKADRTADITCFDRAEHAHRRARLYELLAEESTGPVLARYVLKANEETSSEPYLIVSTGEISQFEIESQHNVDAIRDRVLGEMSLTVGSWKDMGTARNHSNHSKPGLSLVSKAGFDNLRDSILEGQYTLERVINTAHSAPARQHRWDVEVIGTPVARTDVACAICGDDLVAPGFYGTHLRCFRCGTIYCRRNCAADHHGRCPRCGETDRLDGVD